MVNKQPSEFYYNLGLSKEVNEDAHRHRSNSEKFTNYESFLFNNNVNNSSNIKTDMAQK